LAEEGLDIAHLDTILFALPVSIQKEKGSKNIKSDKTLIQSVGRILRNDKLNELTQIPLVIDISDILSIYQGWSRKRDEVYERKNWYVQSYHYADYDYIYGSDQLTDKNPMNIIFDDITDEEFIEKNLITTKKEIDEHEKDSELSADDNVSNKSNSSIPEDVFTATKIKKNKELKDKELKDKELKDNESINQLLDEKSNLIGDSIIDKKKNKKSKKNTITII
jgi:superfamily II DNA or RNA helicase